MKWLFNIIMILLFSSCTKTVYVPIQDENIVKTEIKEIIKDSIIYIHIEDNKQADIIDTISSDTTSILENRYSTSTAEIKSGTLKHTLKTKNYDSIPYKIVYKDIIKTDTITTNKVVIQEVKQPIRDNIFWYSIIGNVVFCVFILKKVKNILG